MCEWRMGQSQVDIPFQYTYSCLRLILFLFKDCIMMPICACSVCDKCARAALTEAKNNNKNNTCPACGTPDNSPEDLIPCRKVRLKVNEFKRKNGSSRVKKSALNVHYLVYIIV